MEWVLVFVLLGVAAAWLASRQRQQSRARLEQAEALRRVRKVADEDVTRFGEELQELHLDTLTTTMDTAMRQDYQRALDAYENAKSQLAEATRPEDITAVTTTMEDGRYAKACVLARQAGEPLPQRRPPCFFNPAHGPAQTDVEWAPPGGAQRQIPVCLADADRIAQGAEPDIRKVRAEAGMVPWWQGGPAYGAWAGGYYGNYAMAGLFPGFILGSMLASPVVVEGEGSDAGGGESGEDDWSGEGGANEGGANEGGTGDDWSGWEGSEGLSGDVSGLGDAGGGWLGGGDTGGGWFGGDGGGWGGGGGDWGGGGGDGGGF